MSERKGKSERLYDLVEERKVVKKVKDPLDEVIEEEERELAREAKRLRLQEIIERRKKEIEKLRGESEKGSEVLSGVSPAMAAELAKLPEDQRKAVIETYAMLKAAEKAQPREAGMGILLPLLIGYMKANPQASQPDLVEFAKVMNEQLKTGMQLAESKKEKEKKAEAAWNPVELIKTFGEIIKENVQKPMEELVQRVQPAPSPFERILMDDKLFERAKALGMFSGGIQQPQAVTPEVKRLEVEVEKIKQDTALKLKEMDQQTALKLKELELQQQRWLAEQKLEQQKWEQIGKLFEGPVGKTIQMLGGGVVRKISGYGGQQASVIQVTCPTCKRKFPVFADAERAICPYCNAVLVKTGGEGAEAAEATKEEETKPKKKSRRK